MTQRTFVLGAGIVIAGVLAYLTSFAGVFLFDDVRHIVEEPRIRTLNDFWGSRPVVALSLAINYRLGALDPFGYHLFNLIVHLLAGLTLFGLVRRITARTERLAPCAPWLAFVVALIWVVHPLQTQSVTYVIQRGESLMGLFYLLTLYCLLRGATTTGAPGAAADRIRRGAHQSECAAGGRYGAFKPAYAAAVLACGLGMASKAVMVTAPVVAFLFDVLVISGSIRLAARRRWGLYVALAATWGVLVQTGVVAGVLGAGDDVRRTVGFDTPGITPLAYAASQPGVILHYLRLALWPHPLCLDYGWPVARGVASVVGPALVLAALGAATVRAIMTRPRIGFTAAAFFLVLAPTSTIVPIRDLAFEHRMYLPLASVVTLVVFGGFALLNRFGPRARRAGFVASLLLAAGLGMATSERNRVYHDAETMWRDVVATRPSNPRGHAKLGRIVAERGDVAAALGHYRDALAVDPEYFPAHHRLGMLLAQTGRLNEAVAPLEEAIRLEPAYFVAHNSLGNVLAALGRADEAIALYAEAIRLEPNMPDPHNNMAIELARRDRVTEAIPHFVEAVRLNPAYEEAKNNLAIVLERTGHIDDAIAPYLDRAPLAAPHAEAHVRAGRRAAREGRPSDAITAFARAVAIDPDHPDAARLLDIERRKEAAGN